MSDAARRLEDALELADLAEQMVRARLRREDPDASDGLQPRSATRSVVVSRMKGDVCTRSGCA